MLVSTRGRYALRVLIDLAEQEAGSWIPLKDIAIRQGISGKYLQHIAKQLVSEEILTGTSGKGGGYKLTKDPKELSVADVLEATEGELASVACLACDAPACERAQDCKTLPLWQHFDKLVYDYFSSITLADLVNGTLPDLPGI